MYIDLIRLMDENTISATRSPLIISNRLELSIEPRSILYESLRGVVG